MAAGSQPTISGFVIDPGTCQMLMYTQNAPTNLDDKKWVLVGGHHRSYRTITQSLQFYPDHTPAALATGAANVLADFDPTDRCPQIGCSGGNCLDSQPACEAGASGSSEDYTVFRLTTADAGTAYINGFALDPYSAGYSNGAPSGLGPTKIFINYGPGDIVLRDYTQTGGNYTTGHGFYFPGNRNIRVRVGGSLWLWHSSHDSYWFPIGGVYGTDAWPRCVPTAFAGGNNELGDDIHGCELVVLQASAASNLVGIDPGQPGEKHKLCNYGPSAITLKNKAASTLSHWLWTPGAADVTLRGAGDCAEVFYEYTNTIWIVTGTTN